MSDMELLLLDLASMEKGDGGQFYILFYKDNDKPSGGSMLIDASDEQMLWAAAHLIRIVTERSARGDSGVVLEYLKGYEKIINNT